jgi:transposase
MLGRNPSEPTFFQMVDVESLVPPDHKLRKIDAVLDLGFVQGAVAECYAPGAGRPSIDPELALRMMLLGVLYDLSDRELCQEIQMHAGMRWFCRLNFHDPVPDHSTLSRLRNERWADSGLFDRLMDEVVRQCGEAGLVSGRHLSVDGTEVRADASIKSVKRRGPHRPPGDPPGRTPPRGREPDPRPAGEWEGRGKTYRNETHFSTTDPNARLYRKGDNREARLSYLAHDLIDTKSRVILRRRASLATGTAEPETALEMLDEVLDAWEHLRVPHQPEIVSADAGYGSTNFLMKVMDRDLLPHIPLRAADETEELPTWKRRTFDLERKRARQRRIQEANTRNRARALQRTRGYRISRSLRIRNEHLFAEGKNHHGMRRARRRGLQRVQDQMTLTAVIQNLKRLAAFRSRKRGPAMAVAVPLPRSVSRLPGPCVQPGLCAGALDALRVLLQ